ncbi:unnamed protein product [Closterium sp. NIES-54]
MPGQVARSCNATPTLNASHPRQHLADLPISLSLPVRLPVGAHELQSSRRPPVVPRLRQQQRLLPPRLHV